MLAPAPIETLEDYLDRWSAAHLDCEPADRRAAEEGVRLAYESVGLTCPRIIWCGGPLEIAQQLADAATNDIIGTNVKAEIFDQVRSRIGTFAEVFWKEVLAAASELSGNARFDAALNTYHRSQQESLAITGAVIEAANSLLDRPRIRAKHALMRWRGLPRLLPRSGFGEAAVGPHDLGSLGVYEYLHDVLAWQEPTQSMRGLWKIAKSASWIVPHQHVCWISDRPTVIRTDTRARLHCPDGPALRYRDGWSHFAWKGVMVPSWAIEHPEWISSSTIADTFDPVLRNCLIEIMTPERFCKNGGATRVARDETGILWRKFWGYRGVTVGSWVAVEVVNGTPEADGSRKRYFLRVPSRMLTAREAVAWTYGLTDEQYAQLKLRT
jgi:hypothetical protein